LYSVIDLFPKVLDIKAIENNITFKESTGN
jgi:hypothetical protein